MTTSDGASGQPLAQPEAAGVSEPTAPQDPAPRSVARSGVSPAAARPPMRALQLVPPLPPEPQQPAPPGLVLASGADQSPVGAGSSSPADPVLAAANRRLERELAEVLEEVGALEELLEELPAIFERKFQQRLVAVLEDRRRLEADHRQLRSQWLTLPPAAQGPPRPHGLLPPGASGEALRLGRAAARRDGGSGMAS